MTHAPSRRGILAAAGALFGTTAGIVGEPVQAIDKTGPLTPAEYLSEMRAIHWCAVASCQNGKPEHVIEYGPEDCTLRTIENTYAFGLIQRRVSKSGVDFWKYASQYLYDQGLREEVWPQGGRTA